MHYKVTCIGAVLVDELYYSIEKAIPATSNPAVMKRSAGGVMRNIAHHLTLLGIKTEFITVAGNDQEGKWLLGSCRKAGIIMENVLIDGCSTGKYTAIINPDGSLHAAAAYNPCEEWLTINFLEQRKSSIENADLVIADTNLKEEELAWIITFCNQKRIPLVLEPVSISKAGKLSRINLEGVFMVTPNEEELISIVKNIADTTFAISELIRSGVKNIWVTKGEQGSDFYCSENKIHLAAPAVKVIDSTGAGDATIAGWIAAYLNGMDTLECIQAGHSLAAVVLENKGAIAENISMAYLKNAMKKYYAGE